MQNFIPQIAAGIGQQLELQLPETVTEEELLHLLALKVGQMLERDTESFFQLMYRLDIPENKLYSAMNTGDAAPAIAHLIYSRQLEKIQSRMQFKPSADDADEELKW